MNGNIINSFSLGLTSFLFRKIPHNDDTYFVKTVQCCAKEKRIVKREKGEKWGDGKKRIEII